MSSLDPNSQCYPVFRQRWIGKHQERVGVFFNHLQEGNLEIIRPPRFEQSELQSQLLCRSRGFLQHGREPGIARYPENSHAGDPGADAPKELQLFADDLRRNVVGQSSNVSTWPREALHQTEFDGP
jgi:hypothetical protein